MISVKVHVDGTFLWWSECTFNNPIYCQDFNKLERVSVWITDMYLCL